MVNYVCVLDLGGKCEPHQTVVFTPSHCCKTPSECGFSYYYNEAVILNDFK